MSRKDRILEISKKLEKDFDNKIEISVIEDLSVIIHIKDSSIDRNKLSKEIHPLIIETGYKVNISEYV